jgi:hypothetical protein
VLPNLIALTTGNKEISRLLGGCDIVLIRKDFGAQLIVLCHTIIVPDPRNVRKQASEGRANNLLFSRSALDYCTNLFGPSHGFACHTGKRSRRPDDSNHFALP